MLFEPAFLFVSMVFGAIGLGLFVYGKKQVRAPQLAVGLALMAYPYFITAVRPLIIVGALLLGGLWLALRLGW